MDDRQTGRTTRQMQDAPQRAIFVWCNHHFAYPRDLSRKIGRPDLELVSPDWLTHDRWRGRTLTGIVVDHAANLTADELDALEAARTRIR